MADNPVAQAKAAYLAARSVWFNYCGTNEAALLDANAKLDALIAAVRAEPKPLSIYPDANRHYSFTDPPKEATAMAEEVIEIDEDGKVTLLGRDTLTVEQAKQALIDETGAAAWERWLPKLDALIAAVRAENDARERDLIERAERYMAELREGR